MVDKHFFGGLLCLMWWVIMLDVVVLLHTVVSKHYCGWLSCLMWWIIMLDLMVFFAYLGG